VTADHRARPLDPEDPFAGLGLVVFDKDGTLIDFDAMWSGWATELADRLAATTGRPVQESLYRALGYDEATGRATARGPLAAMPMAHLRDLTTDVVRASGGDQQAAEAIVAASWRAPDPMARAHPLTDLRALFGGLRARGIRVGVATSDDRAPTEATLAGLGVAGLVDGIVCADDGLRVKPAPDMLVALCMRLGVPPSATAMVGDSTADLAMGRAAGAARCVGVLSGVGSRQDLGPLADIIVGSIAELMPAG
jgi:phosphoglycolate phosphatase